MLLKTPLLFLLSTTIFSSMHIIECARILVVMPACSETHQRFFLPLWEELANRGHNLVVLTTHPNLLRERSNVKVVNLNFTDCSYVQEVVRCENGANMAYFYTKGYVSVTKQQLESEIVQNLIRNQSETFDLLMLEHFYIPMYAFKHRFDVPFIGLSSMAPLSEILEVFGNPTHSVLYPHALNSFEPTGGFFNRLMILTGNLYFKALKILNLPSMSNVVYSSFGSNYSSSFELLQSIDLLLMNWNPVFHGIMPLSPATIGVGGLQVHKPRDLPKFLADFADESFQGLAYWSFGSTVKSSYLSDERLQTIFDAFAQIPYRVICKLDDSDIETKFNVSSNVLVTSYVPQQDLLRHKNMKVFFTQGGVHSLEESILAHVPVVVMPLIADQNNNARKVVEHGIGVQIAIESFTSEQLAATIVDVARSSKYRKRAKEIAAWMQDEPISPLQKAVWWTEYVIRHKGAKHLKAPYLPFYQYYYMDIFAFYFVCVYVLKRFLAALNRRFQIFKCTKIKLQ